MLLLRSLQRNCSLGIATADWEEISKGTSELDDASSVTLDDVPSETAEWNAQSFGVDHTEEKELEIAASYQQSSNVPSMINNHMKEGQ